MKRLLPLALCIMAIAAWGCEAHMDTPGAEEIEPEPQISLDELEG